MPSRPLRACKYPRCPGLTESSFCSEHEQTGQETERQRNRWRGSAASRGYDRSWRKVAAQAAKRDRYLCVMCLAEGVVKPYGLIDHIIPIRVKPDQRLNLDNLQSLCNNNHAVKTQQDIARNPEAYK
jgi:5-methylcytosine-specific restriction protein A